MREVKVRQAVIEDMPAIRRCHAQVEARLGKTMDLPAVDDPAILEYLVAEEDGRIIGFHYQEKAIEMCHGGLSPEATAAFRAHQQGQQMFELAKAAGVRFIHCQVPKKVAGVGKHLRKSGFSNVSHKYNHWVLDLR